MFIQVSQKLISYALSHVAAAVSSKSVIPILTGIKLQASDSGITFTACNSDIMLRYEIPINLPDVNVHKPGTIVIPARYFIDIIRGLTNGLVDITTEENLRVRIQSGKAMYHLSGMDPDEYPPMSAANQKETLHFSNKLLKRWVKQVSFAVSSSETRPVLTGVSCRFVEDQLTMIATDGIRLASRTAVIDEPLNEFSISQVVIPGKHLLEYSKMLQNEEATTSISFWANKIQLKSDQLTMQLSRLEGIFPSLDKITPTRYATEMTVDSLSFLHALERVSLLSGKDHVIKLQTSTSNNSNSIELSSKTAEVGDVMEEVLLETFLGESITLFFNGRYMIDIMRSVDCERVALRFTGKWAPIIVQPIDSPASFYILTPIRSNQ